jgi:DNA repair protein RecO (recombination protein O)
MKAQRFISTPAVVLSSRRMGEINRSITLLSPETGLVTAAAYGARKGKSRLSSRVEPFVSGQFYLYYNPVSGQYTVKDVDEPMFREFLRESLYAQYAASFWAEIILRTHSGGGEYERLFTFLLEALDVLQGTVQKHPDTPQPYLIIQSIWRFLGLIGYQPSFSECCRCGRALSGSGVIYLDTDMQGFACSDCAVSRQAPLSQGALAYLTAALSRGLADALSVKLSDAALSDLRSVSLLLISHVVGRPLKTLQGGIL